MARTHPTIARAVVAGFGLALMSLALARPAGAEPAVGVVNGANVLVTFDTLAPGTFSGAKPITGLQAGERIAGLDFRHIPQLVLGVLPPPRVFALGIIDGATDTVRLYTIDAGTGAATLIPGSTPFAVTSGSNYGMDFNPTTDRIRVVNDGDENFRINPNNGARADAPTNDTNLNPAGNQIAAVAFDRVSIPAPPIVAANTTEYGISLATNSLVTIGDINQTPMSANGGAVLNPKPLGLTLAPGSGGATNFDIAFGATAYATLVNNATGLPGLYTVNLGSGAATLVGGMPAQLQAFTTVPAASAQLAASSASQPESGAATVTVTRTGSLAHTMTVGYSTSDGTATAGDYASVSGTLTFAPDETSKTFTVPIVSDSADEPDESVNVTLSSPSFPMGLGSPSNATLTIVDDDPPPVPPVPPVPPDTAAPTLRLTGASSSMSLTKFRTGVKVSLTPSEPAKLKAELLGTVTRARVSAFNLALATKSLKLAGGRRTITLKPSRRLVGSPRRNFKVRLRVTATDAAGNARVVTKTITVKPPRRA